MRRGPITLPVMTGIGAGDFGFNLYWQTAGLYLLYFYTDVLRIPASTAGLIYMLPLVWDAVLDPLVGALADRTRTRFGRYRPYLLFGGVPLAVSFAAMFVVPMYPARGAILLAALTHVLFRTVYATVSVPYAALSARVTHSGEERTGLAVARMVFAASGAILVAISYVPVAAALGGRIGARAGWLLVATSFAVVATCMLWIAARSARGLDDSGALRPAPGLRLKIRALHANAPAWVVVGAIMASSFCSTFFQKSLIYYFKYAVGSADLGGLALGYMAAIATASIPAWGWLARRRGKRATWLAGLVPLAVGLAAWGLTGPRETVALFVCLGLIGIGTGAGIMCFWAMVPDTVEYAEWRTDIRAESLIFGLVSFAQKAALGLGAGALGLSLARIGYRAGVPQSAAALAHLKLLMCAIPLAGVFVTGLLVALYPISSERHRQMVSEIAERTTQLTGVSHACLAADPAARIDLPGECPRC